MSYPPRHNCDIGSSASGVVATTRIWAIAVDTYLLSRGSNSWVRQVMYRAKTRVILGDRAHLAPRAISDLIGDQQDRRRLSSGDPPPRGIIPAWPLAFVSHHRQPAICMSAARGPLYSTGSTRGAMAARSCFALKIPTWSDRRRIW